MRLPIVLPALSVAMLVCGATALQEKLMKPTGTKPPSWEAFEVEQLIERAAATDSRWTGFLDRPTLSLGLYRLPAGAEDTQQPHTEDETYYVVSGKGVLGELALSAGDGAGVVDERAASFTALAETEILLIELPCGGSS